MRIAPQYGEAESILSTTELSRFLRELPSNRDSESATLRIANALKQLIIDVDEIEIILPCSTPGQLGNGRVHGAVQTADAATAHVRKRSNRMFWLPIIYEYADVDNQLIGSITLRRLRTRPSSSDRIVPIMSVLESTLMNAFVAVAAQRVTPRSGEATSEAEWKEVVQLLNLTSREREVAVCRMMGLKEIEIAKSLSIALNTVKRHMSNIFRKTGISCNAGLVAMCHRVLREIDFATPNTKVLLIGAIAEGKL